MNQSVYAEVGTIQKYIRFLLFQHWTCSDGDIIHYRENRESSVSGDHRESITAKKKKKKKSPFPFIGCICSSITTLFGSFIIITMETNTFCQASWVKNLTDFSRTKASYYFPEDARRDSMTWKGREDERGCNWKIQSKPCPIWLALLKLLGNQTAL